MECMTLKEQSLEQEISRLEQRRYDIEKELDTAPESRRSILEVGLHALRSELQDLYRRKRRRDRYR